jgi:hypothetical protein
MSKLFIGIIYATLAQILTYLQLQGNIKWDWYKRYPLVIYAMSIPLTFLYIKSVECFVSEFDGQVWPSRLIGFAIGIIVFSILTEIFFREPMTYKTIVTILLAIVIVCIQIFWK